MDDYRFNTFCCRAFEIPSIQAIRMLFLLKYYNNEDLAEINVLCLRSELTVAALPKSFIPELETTLLHIGCINSSKNIVSTCIERGDDVNVRDRFGCTPLYYGVCGQNEEIVELLLDSGADMKLNPIDPHLTSLFEMSLRIQNKNIITMLIKAMDKSLHGWDGSTPLHDALNYDNVQAVEMMLNAGMNVNIPNKHGDTLLHFAVRYRNEHLVRLLPQYQVNVNMTNKKGQTPLFDAVRAESMELIQMLLNMNADVNIVDEEGNTLLDIAVNYSNDLFQLLLQNGAYLNGTNRIRETPLFRTVKFNDTQKMQILLNADANVNIQDVNGNTALHIAIDSYSKIVASRKSSKEANHTKMIEMLLKANANVDIANKWGDTPLHKAASAGFEDVVQLLLQHKANLYATNCQHETPLFLAVLKEQIAIINILLNEERKLNMVKDGATPLNLTVRNGAENKGNIYINMESQSGDTPLCCAIRTENVEIMEVLLRNGADVNYVDKKGRHLTPLFTAIETQNKKIIKILFREGAEINFKSNYDVTPLYVAILLGNTDIIKLLIKRKAHLNIVTSINTLLTKAKHIGDINGALGLLNIWAKRSPNSLTYVTFSSELKDCIQIVENEADINLMDEFSLDREENNVELVHALLKVAAEVTNQAPIGIECLNTILKLDDEEIDRILIQNFQEKYKEFMEGLTDVEYAAIKGNRTMVQILLRNKTNKNNISLTRVIQRSQQKYPVEILVENQIDVNLPDENGDSPLLTALDCSTADVVKILIENGAAVNGVNKDQPNRTPLRVAIRKSRLRSVHMLLENGANINVENKPMLHSASKGKSTKIVHMLLEHGADPNQTDEYGQTALHHAVINNRQYIVKKLLEFKAAVNIADGNGLIPLDYVTGMDSDDIISMLRRK
ncbi:ankyrin repeat-containing protein [Holotrichia oblita]|uniref:Ankyrin repeat-containing protein n=1 Tax=Holotrichia oblita TaxID=644536 RepID=A0ACB9SIG5_HOLOL|nr:ankyrin repeat-containing protein [Holotrichia oblita]